MESVSGGNLADMAFITLMITLGLITAEEEKPGGASGGWWVRIFPKKHKESELKQEDTTMEAKNLTLSDLERVTGGELDSITTDYLNEVIYRAKRADKSLEQCIQDFYRYNKDFNKEQEAYIRAHWNNIA